MRITCYVTSGYLIAYETAEQLRRATAIETEDSERSARSNIGGGTGAFVANVADQTVKRNAPQAWKLQRR